MNLLKVNINDKIYFKPTIKGLEVWRNHFNQFPIAHYDFEDHLESYTINGYYFMQIHVFMDIFSNHLHTGLLFETNSLYFETNLV